MRFTEMRLGIINPRLIVDLGITVELGGSQGRDATPALAPSIGVIFGGVIRGLLDQ